MKEIKFTAPRDIKTGEIFTFDELFKHDENLSAFNDATNDLILEKVKSQLREKEIELSKEFENKNNEQEKMFNEIKEKWSKESEELLSKQKEMLTKEAENSVASEKNELKSNNSILEAKVEFLENINKENKDTLSKLKETYDDLLQQRLSDEREKFSLKEAELIKEMQDKRLSATTIGEDAEEEIRMKLKELFVDDIITKPNHATGGADVQHDIVNRGEVVSSIYYEVKNRKTWNKSQYDNFADKVRKEKHDFNIFIAKSLPKATKEQQLTQFSEDLFYDEVNNIYLTSFENWLPVIAVIRKQAITITQLKNNSDQINDIKEKVYTFFKSPEFMNYFSRIIENLRITEGLFKSIQSSTIKGVAEINKATIEIETLKTDIDTKLNI